MKNLLLIMTGTLGVAYIVKQQQEIESNERMITYLESSRPKWNINFSFCSKYSFFSIFSRKSAISAISAKSLVNA